MIIWIELHRLVTNLSDLCKKENEKMKQETKDYDFPNYEL